MENVSKVITTLALLTGIVPIYTILGVVFNPNGDGNMLVTALPLTLITGGLLMGVMKIIQKSHKAATVYSAISLVISTIVCLVIVS